MRRLFFIGIIFIVFLASASYLVSPFFVHADTVESTQTDIEALQQKINNRKTKQEQIQHTISAYSKKIQKTQTQTASLKNQIAILNASISKNQAQINLTSSTIATLSLQIQQLSLQIQQKQQNITKQKQLISALLRNIQQNGSKNMVEVLATYTSFSQFYNQMQGVRTVEKDLAQTAKALGVAMQQLQTEQKQVKTQQQTYNKMQEKFIQEKKQLQEQRIGKQDILDQTQSSEKRYQTLISSYKALYRQINNDIRTAEHQMRKKLAEQNKLKRLPPGATQLIWPISSHFITTFFHDPEYPYNYLYCPKGEVPPACGHPGWDIATPENTPVHAAATGYIGQVHYCSSASCYAYIMIIHANGISTVYGHLHHIYVAQNQFVTQGDIIGLSGAVPGMIGSGPFTTGAHLHFEVRKNGIPVNPGNYLYQ